ncbi:MAG: hypothetical protein IT269_10610 [Saprospiraceae bacterium]|nr:hypothetical protein [Saprospiraceae bacterium]
MMFSANDLVFLSAEKDLLDLGESLCQRDIWIISSDVRSAATQDFLSKILSAIQADLDRDALWAALEQDTKLNLNGALNMHRPKLILVFGLTAGQVGLRAEMGVYQSVFFYGCNWIFSDALAALEPDRNKKGLLWSALKSVNLS